MIIELNASNRWNRGKTETEKTLMKKRYLVIVISLLVTVGIVLQATSCQPGQNTESQNTINIGLLVPLTGGAASYGQNSRRGAELALKEFSAQHPDIKVELRVEDSRGEAAVGTRALSKLVDLDRVVAVVGCVTSSVTLAVAPTLNERKVPIVSPGASSPNITNAGEYVFRTWPSDIFESDRMVQYINEQRIGKIAVLRINNEYGLAMESALRPKLGSSNSTASIVMSDTFEQGAREMRAQLQRIKDSRAEAIYFVGFPEAAVVFGRGYAEAGLRARVLSTSAFEDPQVPQNTGGVLNGTVYTKPITSGARSDAFKAAYRSAFGEDSGVTSDTAYDATMLILNAILDDRSANRQVTGESIHNYLLRVSNYAGASGTLSFDSNGDVVKTIGLFTLRNGDYEELSR